MYLVLVGWGGGMAMLVKDLVEKMARKGSL